MKQLLLLRHAKSSWDDPGLADVERPLARRGRRASELIAEHLRSQRIKPKLVLCSPSRRTRETLERIGLDDSDQRIEDDLYAASAEELLGVITSLADDIDSAMLIGHNPGLQDLALRLVGSAPEVSRLRRKFPTAALATLEFEGGWHELAPGSAELVAFVRPKDLKRDGT